MNLPPTGNLVRTATQTAFNLGKNFLPCRRKVCNRKIEFSKSDGKFFGRCAQRGDWDFSAVPVTPFSLASGCPKNFSCWLIGDFSPSTWQKFFITKRSDAEGTHPDHEHRHCRPACFLSHLRPPYHPAFATSPPTNAIFVSFHWSCGLECTICRASKSIQVFAWLLSVRWRSLALAVMTNSIVHGRRLAAVPSLPPKKTGPRNSTVAPWLGRFPSGALQNHLQCFHPIGVFSAGVDSRPVPPPTAESGAGNTEPPPGAIRPRSPPGPHSPRFCCRRCQTEPRLVLQPITWFEQRRLTAPRGTNTQNSPVPFPISIASTGPRRRGNTMGRFRVSGSHPARRQETRPSSAEP